MNKEFVPYEEALELKALGFDEYCMEACYYEFKDRGNSYMLLHTPDSYDSKEGVKAPLYQQAFRWFREKHKLHYPIAVSDGVWFYAKWSLGGYKTYEEAELECLKKLIEIVKDKKINIVRWA